MTGRGIVIYVGTDVWKRAAALVMSIGLLFSCSEQRVVVSVDALVLSNQPERLLSDKAADRQRTGSAQEVLIPEDHDKSSCLCVLQQCDDDTSGKAISNMWLVLDRSRSMGEDVFSDRWGQAKASVFSLLDIVERSDREVSLGLLLYPKAKTRGDRHCEVGSPQVMLRKSPRAAFQHALDAHVGYGATPIHAALTEIAQHIHDHRDRRTLIQVARSSQRLGGTLAKQSADNTVVVLITDGQQSDCHGSGSMDRLNNKSVEMVKQWTKNRVVTFAIGFGRSIHGDMVADTELLKRIAHAGGTEPLLAEDEEELSKTLAQIFHGAGQCFVSTN